jgi:hypothetical protein
VIEHLGQLDFLEARENVILLGPPGTGKTLCESPILCRPGWVTGWRRQVADLTQKTTAIGCDRG